MTVGCGIESRAARRRARPWRPSKRPSATDVKGSNLRRPARVLCRIFSPQPGVFHGSRSHAAGSARHRTKKGPGSDPEASKDESVKHPEHHHNAAEEGETANINRTRRTKASFAAAGRVDCAP